LGEICRYLLAQPPSSEDKKHSVRIFIGGGLRPEIWQEFMDRFQINQVGEAYGSTEGNCNCCESLSLESLKIAQKLRFLFN